MENRSFRSSRLYAILWTAAVCLLVCAGVFAFRKAQTPGRDLRENEVLVADGYLFFKSYGDIYGQLGEDERSLPYKEPYSVEYVRSYYWDGWTWQGEPCEQAAQCLALNAEDWRIPEGLTKTEEYCSVTHLYAREDGSAVTPCSLWHAAWADSPENSSARITAEAKFGAYDFEPHGSRSGIGDDVFRTNGPMEPTRPHFGDYDSYIGSARLAIAETESRTEVILTVGNVGIYLIADGIPRENIVDLLVSIAGALGESVTLEEYCAMLKAEMN